MLPPHPGGDGRGLCDGRFLARLRRQTLGRCWTSFVAAVAAARDEAARRRLALHVHALTAELGHAHAAARLAAAEQHQPAPRHGGGRAVAELRLHGVPLPGGVAVADLE